MTKAQALKHPNWDMGAKITIDSASLMNKGLEVIEAKWLFNLKPEQIEVVVHPQSIIHSLVQFEDGSIKAQLGLPDMKLPIQYALAYPERLRIHSPLRLFPLPRLHLRAARYRNIPQSGAGNRRDAQRGNMACIVNAANEVAVAAFLEDRIGFWK